MKVPGVQEAVAHLEGWCAHKRWRAGRKEVMRRHFGWVLEKFGLRPAALGELLDPYEYELVRSCALEDFFTQRFGSERRNVVDEYLEWHGGSESPGARGYLEALRDSVMSLYEVAEVKPGVGLVLRDLIRGGEPVEVDERLGSERLVRWDRIGARVLKVGGRRCLSGAVLHFPHEVSEIVLRCFGRCAAGLGELEQRVAPVLGAAERQFLHAMVTDKEMVLEAGAGIFTQAWLACALDRLFGPPPKLTNFDGEEVVFSKVRFRIEGGSDEIERRLDGAKWLERQAPVRARWSWLGRDSAARPKLAGDVSMAMWKGPGEQVLGFVELGDKHLVLESNSRERAERGRTLLKELLGELVDAPLLSLQSVAGMLEAHGGRQEAGRQRDGAGIPRSELERIEREFLDRQYRRTLDEPVPMLGNVAPRAAVETAAGKQRVVEWLKYLENCEGRRARDTGGGPYDFTWMWRELGIAGERR
jgi:hypothetical protein